jgi:AcrR family transcriptional regulator
MAGARLPRAERRDQIVGVAAATFLAAGYEKASMEEIARAAGVTRLIVYRIFESKEGLYLAVLTSVLDDLAEQFSDDASPRHAPDRPTGVAARLLAVARRRPDAFRLLWRHAADQPEFHKLFTQFKDAATEYGVALIHEISPNPTVVRWSAESIVSHLYESICLWLDNGDPTIDEQFLAMLQSGSHALVTAWAASSS